MRHKQIQHSVREWLYNVEWDVSITLTFERDTRVDVANRMLTIFQRKINQKAYGNLARRNNIKLSCVVFSENSILEDHFHYHAALKMPKNYKWSVFDYCIDIGSVWNKMSRRHKHYEFKPAIVSEGWVDYITKRVDNDNCDSFDLHSSYIATADRLTI